MNQRCRIAGGILVTILISGACGGGGGGEGPTGPSNPNNPGGPSGTVSVSMQAIADGYGSSTYQFNPGQATVVRGGTVTWTNPTGTVHNVTFQTAGAPSNIADHGSGSNTRTFSNAGTFAYRCTNHAGMEGSITVQ